MFGASRLSRFCSSQNTALASAVGAEEVIGDSTIERTLEAAGRALATPSSDVELDVYDRGETSPSFIASQFEEVCASPIIKHCEQFLTPEKCEELIRLASSKFEPSSTLGIEEPIVSSHRVSETAFFFESDVKRSSALQKIVDISKQLTEKPDASVEIQISKYVEGGKFEVHYDPLEIGFGQRRTTLLAYLNTPTSGGKTVFYKPVSKPECIVRKNERNGKMEVFSSLKGDPIYEVTPVKGSAVFFRNLDDEGQLDFNSLHAGQRVIMGEKFILTAWASDKN